MRGNTHVRFGGGGGKTLWRQRQEGRPAPILLNPTTEWPILDVLRYEANEFTMFASPSQQIYGFRGANWKKLTSKFPDSLSVDTMRNNYRSTPEIIRAASPLAGTDASSMVPVRESLDIPVLAVDALNQEMEADFIGRQVGEWLNHGIEASQIAILARVHTTLNTIQLSLRTRNIPFQIVGGRTSIFHREDTQALLGSLDIYASLLIPWTIPLLRALSISRHVE